MVDEDKNDKLTFFEIKNESISIISSILVDEFDIINNLIYHDNNNGINHDYKKLEKYKNVNSHSYNNN